VHATGLASLYREFRRAANAREILVAKRKPAQGFALNECASASASATCRAAKEALHALHQSTS